MGQHRRPRSLNRAVKPARAERSPANFPAQSLILEPNLPIIRTMAASDEQPRLRRLPLGFWRGEIEALQARLATTEQVVADLSDENDTLTSEPLLGASRA